MEIKNYFLTIIKRIKRLNIFISNPQNYKDIDNPFIRVLPRTYVWIDNEKIK